MKTIRTLFHIIFSVAVFAVFALACILFITTQKRPLWNIHSYSILTGSMSPHFPVGTVVFTKPEMRYELGDVIAFKRKGETVTHRVISYRTVSGKRIYIVKGDANNAADLDGVQEDDVIGTVFFSLPAIGKFMTLLHTPKGLFLIIGTPAVLLILHEIWTIKTEYEIVIEKKVRKKLEKEMHNMIRRYLSESQTAHG